MFNAYKKAQKNTSLCMYTIKHAFQLIKEGKDDFYILEKIKTKKENIAKLRKIFKHYI